MRFVDEVKIQVKGGRGGDGCIGWRREKYLPRGGPDGGNGGNGGAVIFVADPSLNTLIDFAFAPILKASDGENGRGGNCAGSDGENVIRAVPVGTQVFYGGSLVADLSVPKARWIAARGGRGGRGNSSFKSSVNRAPDYAEAGQEGESFEFTLVLKSVADIGLIGLPNVGKSTLIAKITRSQPKIAQYPFTTLRPNLGVVLIDERRRFVVADIPGLVPGAHRGRGLGVGFLRHVERTTVLVQIIDVSSPSEEGAEAAFDDTWSDDKLRAFALVQFELVDAELRLFSAELSQYPRIVAFSKADLPQSRRAYTIAHGELRRRGFPTTLFSSHTGEGIPELIEIVGGILADTRCSK